MPLYLVNWNDMSFALIRAQDEHDLFWKLDQQGNPYEASFRQYRGPLYLRLKLDANFEAQFEEGQFSPVDLELKEAGNVNEIPRFRIKMDHIESKDEMYAEITKKAFPALSEYYDKVFSDDHEELTLEDLRQAMLEDMQRMPEPTFDSRRNWYE